MYDIAIIGTGPAGISAAITAKARNKNILLIGSGALSDKIRKAHMISNYPGIPDVSGDGLAEKLLLHLINMDISINEEKVTAVYAMGEYFAIQTDKGMHEATTVVVATGVIHGKSIPGEDMLLGRGVSYCATCDAALYRGRRVAVISYNKRFEHEADFLSEVAETVYYIPMYKSEIDVASGVTVVNDIPVQIEGDIKVNRLILKNGEYDIDGVFVLRDSIAPDKLVPGIETEKNHIKVDINMVTNIPGCYACGDVVGEPYQYIKAAGQGNIAALSAVSYIDNKNRNTKKKEM